MRAETKAPDARPPEITIRSGVSFRSAGFAIGRLPSQAIIVVTRHLFARREVKGWIEPTAEKNVSKAAELVRT